MEMGVASSKLKICSK